MGVDIADLNNDALPELFSLDMMPFSAEIGMRSGGEDSDKVRRIKQNYGFGEQYARNTLQWNTGEGYFQDVALMSRTHATEWSWSALLQDYDNDGLRDIFITNGIYKRPNDLDYINYISNIDFAQFEQEKQAGITQKLIAAMPQVKPRNIVFRNEGETQFERLSETAGLNPSYSNGAAYADLDNDGDLDLVVNNINQNASLLENKHNPTEKNQLTIVLKDSSRKRNTLGTKVTLYSNKEQWYAEQYVVKGFQSSSSHKLHFGLGKTTEIDSIHLIWPDGKFQKIRGQASNQQLTVTRQENLPDAYSDNRDAPRPQKTYTYFPFAHLENSYEDYEREVLMPEKLSMEGPAAVKADFNGDGLVDLFIGGAKYQSPGLYFGNDRGAFTEQKQTELRKDIIYEDVDAAAFDIENDGDLDLYVMSGGNEMAEGHPNLEDRIYLNDGNGNFERLAIPLIRTNGGSISAADFDGNGYDDLFIGNRSMPGGYGLSPISYILKNDGTGKFSVLQQERLGMVTDSEWFDINTDGMLDLIIVGDWMPITILINQEGRSFLDMTDEYGLNDTQGFWNVVKATDIDSNGIVDLLVGNTGLNHKFKASITNPVKMYVDDFDGNGQPDPIIFYDFFGAPLPFASKDKLVQQLPELKKQYLSYTAFSKITGIEKLTDIPEDSIMETKVVRELRSMAYLNIGENMKAIPLPLEAQRSAIQDIMIHANGVITYVGNFLGHTNELGQNSENTGGELQWDPNGVFHHKRFLDLPKGLDARKVLSIPNDRLLILLNDDRAYLLAKIKPAKFKKPPRTRRSQ